MGMRMPLADLINKAVDQTSQFAQETRVAKHKKVEQWRGAWRGGGPLLGWKKQGAEPAAGGVAENDHMTKMPKWQQRQPTEVPKHRHTKICLDWR